jgi:hypothetical protein
MPSPLLNLAAESGYAEVVKVLLDEAHVPVDSLGEFGTSPLFDACYFDNRQMTIHFSSGLFKHFIQVFF